MLSILMKLPAASGRGIQFGSGFAKLGET